MKTQLFFAISAIAVLGGCATTQTSSVDVTRVSPTHYQEYNCAQINAEKQRVSSKVEQSLQGNQTDEFLNTVVNVYAISQGYGFDTGEGNQELVLLKNKLDVLEETSIRKQCGL